MQHYKFNLWRDMARTKCLFAMSYPSVEAAERDGIKLARAMSTLGASDDVLDGWIELQDIAGDVQSIIPIRLAATRPPARLHQQSPARAA